MKQSKSISYCGVVAIDVPQVNLYLVVNKSVEQIKEFLKKQGVVKASIDTIERELKEADSDGFFMRTSEDLRFMYLKECTGTWQDLDVLNHETFHFVDFESEYRMFAKESEFKAYLHEATFRKLRKILFNEKDKMDKKIKHMVCKTKGKKKKK
ncbi:hypothetical protein HGB13_00145 [bacterium]|nr:hypothetical protein [bacterium]